MNFNGLINTPEYDFLRTNPHLKDRLFMLNVAGSHAYGTDTETSDVDIRGCAFNTGKELIGFQSFEQYEDKKTDSVIFSFNKYIRLLMAGNPSVVESLGCKPEHYLYLSDDAKYMLEHPEWFLSKKAINAFEGFASQQLQRLENALARDRLPQEKREEHILDAIQRASKTFADKYEDFNGGNIRLKIDTAENEDLEKEIFADIELHHYPLRSFNAICNDMTNVLKTYGKLTGRLHRKDEAHLDKHAMHLLRLYYTAIDLLERGKIITYRGEERDLLLYVRAGGMRNKDGSYKEFFFDLLDTLKARADYAKKHTSLPDTPNYEKIEEFVMKVNRRSLET